MKKEIKITLSEQDLKRILEEHFGLRSSTLNISVSQPDRPYENTYTSIVLTGEQIVIKD